VRASTFPLLESARSGAPYRSFRGIEVESGF
jgi:hypothetical protein